MIRFLILIAMPPRLLLSLKRSLHSQAPPPPPPMHLRLGTLDDACTLARVYHFLAARIASDAVMMVIFHSDPL